MLGLLKLFKKLVQLFMNFLFIVQITLMILIFFTAAYWLFNLLGSDMFSFAEPLANGIIQFVKMFYTREIVLGDIYVDGSLILFDLISLIVVFLIAKSKYYINIISDKIDNLIESEKKSQEEIFNKQLQKEVDTKIKRMSNVALLIEVDLIDPFARKLKRSDIKERDLEGTKDNAMKVLYLALKGINNCKFLKSGNRLVLMFDEFKNIDNVFFFVEQAVKRIVAKMNDENWDLRVYVSAEAYEDSANFRKDVLASLEKLIVLKQKNQIVCFGNLKMRYEMKPERLYDIELLHGTYEIDGGTDVFVLVKKN